MDRKAGIETPLLGRDSHVDLPSNPVSGQRSGSARRSEPAAGNRIQPDAPLALAPLASQPGTFVDRAGEFLTLRVGGSEGRNIATRLEKCFVPEPGKDRKGLMFLDVQRLNPSDREAVTSELENLDFQKVVSAHAASAGSKLSYIVTMNRSSREPQLKNNWSGEPARREIYGRRGRDEEQGSRHAFVEGIAPELAKILSVGTRAAKQFARDVLIPNIQHSLGLMGQSNIGILMSTCFFDMRPVFSALQDRVPERAYEALLAIERNPTISRHVDRRAGGYPVRTLIPVHPRAMTAIDGAGKARKPLEDGAAGI